MLNLYLLERQVMDTIDERQREAARSALIAAHGHPPLQRIAALGRSLFSRARRDAACCADAVAETVARTRAAARTQDVACCA
jgi:hypothetical protein